MQFLIFFVSFIFFTHGKRLFIDHGLHPLSDEMIDQINSLNTTWRAGKNFDIGSFDYVKRVLRVLGEKSYKYTQRVQHRIPNDLPRNFDAREAWPNCTSLSTILDQGNCASWWALAAVEAISDRLCIHKSLQVLLSAQQLVSCYGDGCAGGWPYEAFQIYQNHGLVTEKCSPYTLPPCEHYIKGPLPTCPQTYRPAPECKKECASGYPKKWDEDKFFGQSPYSVDADQKQIMTEIMTNGPVSALFSVYADFPNYKSGVYQKTSNQRIGVSAAKIIGWGTETDTDYWLVANSWNDYWGDKGYFKIKRGNDECGIESAIVAGLPK